MKMLHQLVLIAVLCAASNAALPTFEFRMEAPLAAYLQDAERFDGLAGAYAEFLGMATVTDDMDDKDRLFLAAGRVHLALLMNDFDGAMAAAETIRDMQSDPEKRALTGLVTRALVEARRRHPGEAWTPYAMTVQRQFSALLALARPRPSRSTPAINGPMPASCSAATKP